MEDNASSAKHRSGNRQNVPAVPAFPRRSVTEADRAAYVQRARHGPCFVCEILAKNPEYPHHIIHQDNQAIVFLDKYPTLYGHTLVAPREHREQATGDFTLDEYLTLQHLVYRVSEAVSQVVPTERMYILTLGSQQGNRHVHWHVVPLPPGVPYDEQQLEALNVDRGIMQVPEDEMASLAARIRQAMAQPE